MDSGVSIFTKFQAHRTQLNKIAQHRKDILCQKNQDF